jgi:transmembrane sensor
MSSAAPRQVIEAAATWYVQFQCEAPSPAQLQAWQRWLDSDASHRHAWEQMERMQRQLGALPREMSRRALSAGQQRRQVLKVLALFGATGYLGWSLQDQVAPLGWWADYRTGIGQRRSIELADGTQLQLNTDSAVDIQFGPSQRLIQLQRGEIMIRTGKAPQPFFVTTAQGQVQALGTTFTVRQLSTTTRVGVLEDEVRLLPKDRLDDDQRLHAGESAEFDRSRIGTYQAYGASQAAWVNGQLIVLNATLGEIVTELDRYRPGTLRCDGQSARLRVSGTFRVDDSDAVLANLQATLPIKVEYFTRYWASISRR